MSEKENIRYGRLETTDAEVIEAAKVDIKRIASHMGGNPFYIFIAFVV